MSPGVLGVLVPVNSASLSSTLIESELFGHVRGSFTGAASSRQGLIEQASGGTLFLDEVGELPLEMQTKLLRALEEKKIRPVGGRQLVPVDVRLIAATSRDLATEVEQGRFRADLFYRLNVITVRLPPLRERRDDIALLIHHFLSLYAPAGVSFSDAALRWMLEYDWPGNVRQLENCIQRIAALCSRATIDVCDLPSQLRNAVEALIPQPKLTALSELEKAAIQQAMKVSGDDCRKAAEILGISKTKIYRKLKQYGQSTETEKKAHT